MCYCGSRVGHVLPSRNGLCGPLLWALLWATLVGPLVGPLVDLLWALLWTLLWAHTKALPLQSFTKMALWARSKPGRKALWATQMLKRKTSKWDPGASTSLFRPAEDRWIPTSHGAHKAAHKEGPQAHFDLVTAEEQTL